MTRPARSALLVALAALAGCSLAAGPDGIACINSCYCHYSDSAGSPPLIGPAPPLMGAAPAPSRAQGSSEDCGGCTLKTATWGLTRPNNSTVSITKACDRHVDVLQQLQHIWRRNAPEVIFPDDPEKNDIADNCGDRFFWITTTTVDKPNDVYYWPRVRANEHINKRDECC